MKINGFKYFYPIMFFLFTLLVSCKSSINENQAFDSVVNEEESYMDEAQESPSGQKLAQSLSADELKEYEIIALGRMKDFKDLITIVGNRKLDKTFRKHAANQLIMLFQDKNVTMNIDITGKGKEISLDEMLKNLYNAGFTRFSFKIDTSFISQSLQRIDDSTYIGSLVFQQKIIGLKKRDTTCFIDSYSNVEVFLKQQQKLFGDEILPIWEIKLGNMVEWRMKNE